jgi:hypothetical protein
VAGRIDRRPAQPAARTALERYRRRPRGDRVDPRVRGSPTGPVLRATKSHRVYRVAIDDATIRRLAEHHRRAETRAAAHGLHLGESAFVFSSRPDGSWPWLPNRVTKTFIAHRRQAGVGRFRLHDLRHFMATQMLNAGVPVPTVSERLGHARASTTLNIYGHCVPGADHVAAEFIAALITPGGDTTRNDPGRAEAPMDHDIDLTADLNAQDDDDLGPPWPTRATPNRCAQGHAPRRQPRRPSGRPRGRGR